MLKITRSTSDSLVSVVVEKYREWGLYGYIKARMGCKCSRDTWKHLCLYCDLYDHYNGYVSAYYSSLLCRVSLLGFPFRTDVCKEAMISLCESPIRNRYHVYDTLTFRIVIPLVPAWPYCACLYKIRCRSPNGGYGLSRGQ